MKWKLVPEEIDRATCRPMLDVWNRCMADLSTLETTWPQLVAAAPFRAMPDVSEAVKLAQKDVRLYDSLENRGYQTNEEKLARALLAMHEWAEGKP